MGTEDKAPEFKTYRVHRVTGRNVRSLVEFDIVPPLNGVVVVAGANGIGKSSVVDGMLLPLGGKDKSQVEMIRHGQDEMEVTTDCGDFIANRLVSRADNVLVVKRANGEPQPQPATFLAGIKHDLTIDPLAFARMKDPEMAELLMRTAGITEEVAGFDSKIAALKEERKTHNKAHRDAVGQLRGLNAPEPDTPTDCVKVTELVEERKRRQKVADENAVHERQYLEAGAEERHARDDLDRAQKAYDQCLADYRDKAEFCETLPDPQVEEIDAKLGDLEALNSRIAKAITYRANVAQRDDGKTNMDRIDGDVKAQELGKRNLLVHSELPVEGLTYDGAVVRWFKSSVGQLSFSERVRIGMRLAMAANKELRIVRIEQGGELDDETKAEVDALGKACDYQVWVEQPGIRADATTTVADGRAVNA